MGRLIFIAAPEDMTDWRDLATDYIDEFKERGELADIEPFSARGFDNAELNHAETYQEAIQSPARLGASMTIVLLGETVGLQLDENFRYREDIAAKFREAGIDWIRVPGVSQPELRPDNVPLTGTLFEYFDTVLSDTKGAGPTQCRIFFRGTRRGRSEINFGNGEFLKKIDALPPSDREVAILRYAEQISWRRRFYDNWAGAPQRPLVFCKDAIAFLRELETALKAVFVHQDSPFIASRRRRRADPRTVTLPSLAPFDEDRVNFYFGRDRQKRELASHAVNTLASGQRLTALLGPSGSGKSSLLRAGLMAQMRTRSRRRQGWRSAFVSLSEKPSAQSPILFLAEVLAAPAALHEIGPPEVLAQRLSGLDPVAAAARLLEIVLAVPPAATLRQMLLVIDQFEFAVECAAGDGTEESKAEWNAFISFVGALTGARPGLGVAPSAERQAGDPPRHFAISVVVGLTDGETLARSGLKVHAMVEVPWLLDPTEVQHIVVETFNELGLSIDPAVVAGFRAEVEQSEFQAPALPLLSAALHSLHENWKARQRGRSAGPPGDGAAGTKYDIALADFDRCGRLKQAVSWLGEAAFREAGGRQNEIAQAIFDPAYRSSYPELGPAAALNFAFGSLLRQLVTVAEDGAIPDRLRPTSPDALELLSRPLYEALMKYRLLTRRKGGEVWLVHPSVLRDWPRAALWRRQEAVASDIERRIRSDLERWRRDRKDGYDDADRRLWTNEREIEDAFTLLSMRGMDFDADIIDFITTGSLRAAERDSNLAGMGLVIAAFFGSCEWAHALLDACRDPKAAVNWVSADRNAAALHNAAARGDVDLVALLLRNGADRGLVAGGRTALHVAAAAGQTAVCELFLDGEIDLDAPDGSGRRPLHLAAKNGDFETCAALLRAGAVPTSMDSKSATALHFAASAGNLELCRLLVDKEVDVQASDLDGNTPLHFAAAFGHVAICRLLVAKRADKNCRNRSGATPLDHAARLARIDVVSYLLDADASASTTDLTALIFNGADVSIISRLLERGALLNGLSFGMPPLISAVRAGMHEIFWRLLAKGAQPSVTAPGHVTLAHAIAEQNDWQLLEALIARRVSLQLDEPRDDGRTPLDICRIVGAAETERILFDEGVPDRAPRTANQFVAMPPIDDGTGRHEISQSEQILEPPQLIVAWFNGRGILVMNHDGRFSEPPLQAAYDVKRRVIHFDFENYVRREYYILGENPLLHDLLMIPRDRAFLQQQNGENLGRSQQLGFHVLLTDDDFLVYEASVQRLSQAYLLHGDETPGLQLVAGTSPRDGERPRISMSLLAPAPSPVAFAGQEPTTLASAVEANDLELVKHFARSAPPESIGRGSTTPLHIAAARGQLEIVEYLIGEEVRMPVDVPDGADQLPADLAAANGHQEVVELLMRADAPEPCIWHCPRVSDEASFLSFGPVDEADPWLRDMLKGCGNRLIISFETMRLRSAPLAFADGASVLAIEDTLRRGRREQFAIYRPGKDFVLLDWTNEPIYLFMSRNQVQLRDDTVADYARFFFHFVRGFLGRFLIKEPGGPIRWKAEATVEVISDVSAKIAPLTVCEITSEQFTLDAWVIFRNALFFTKIGIARRYFEGAVEVSADVDEYPREGVQRLGEMRLFGETLELEDLLIMVDGPPGIFG